MKCSPLLLAIALGLFLGAREGHAAGLVFRTEESEARDELATRLHGEFRALGIELREIPVEAPPSDDDALIEVTSPVELSILLPEAKGGFLVLRLSETEHAGDNTRVLAVRAAEIVEAWQRRKRFAPPSPPVRQEDEIVVPPPEPLYPRFGASLGPSLVSLPDLGTAWGLSASGFARLGSWLRVELSLHPSLTEVSFRRSAFEGQLSLQMASAGAVYELSIAPRWRPFLGTSLGASFLSL